MITLRRRTFTILFLCAFFLAFPISVSAVYEGDGDTSDTYVQSGLSEYDFTGIQKVMDEALASDSINFMELLTDLISGKMSEAPAKIWSYVIDKLFAEIRSSRHGVAQVMMIAVIGAIFTNFATIFTKSQISEAGFYITYLLMITFLASAFVIATNIARDVIGVFIYFIQALMPAYFLAAAFAGGSATSIAFYELMVLLIYLIQMLILNGLIPLINIYMVLTLVNHISKDEFLSRLVGLIKTVIDWTLKTLLGVVLGFNVIQSMVLPFADSMKNSALSKLISVIPGLGQGINAASEIILGAGVLIKNGIGTAALIILVVIAAVPLLKLTVISLMYQGAAAIVQPVSDKRMTACIDSMAAGTKLLLRVVITALVLFLVTIAATCSSTNIGLFTR